MNKKSKPDNIKLYNKIKSETKKKFKVYPSAYANGWLIKEYKRRGGSFIGSKKKLSGLDRWYKEKWINVCELPKKVPCGRNKLDKNWMKNYPYCRPSIKISKKTPKTYKEISKKVIKSRCSRKKKSPLKRIF